MKKIVFILLVILLTSCSFFGKNSDNKVEEAKQELLGEDTLTNNEDIVSENTETGELSENEKENIEETNLPTVKTTHLTSGEPIIEIEDLSNKDFYSGEFYINGKVLGEVDKIEVSFSNDTSSYPPDLYKLKQFKSGDPIFKYMTSSSRQTLDFGLNKYIFTAYSGDSTYKIKVEINIPEKEKTSSINIEKDDYSPPTNIEKNTLGNDTEINNLTIKEDFATLEVNCTNLTDFLVENYGYSYWNSCRDITKDKSIGFYVLRLKGENYFYEKHYVNYDTKQYGILLLETGVGITKDMIKDKNDELKQVSWDQVLQADKKFK